MGDLTQNAGDMISHISIKKFHRGFGYSVQFNTLPDAQK